MKQIIQNEVKCLKCGDIIWSGHRHDFKTCSCGNISVDGGLDYIRRVGNMTNYEERSLTVKDKDDLNAANWVVSACKENGKTPLDIAIAVHTKFGKSDKLKGKAKKGCVKAVQWGLDTGRNSLGIVLAVIRALRDNNELNRDMFE